MGNVERSIYAHSGAELDVWTFECSSKMDWMAAAGLSASRLSRLG